MAQGDESAEDPPAVKDAAVEDTAEELQNEGGDASGSLESETLESEPLAKRRPWLRHIVISLLSLIALLLFLVVAGLALLNSDYGKGLIVDQIAANTLDSGLHFEVGRIDGNIYGQARLHGVTAYDDTGAFLSLPLVELDWRPISWLTSGLDIRKVETHGGILFRAPELRPDESDAPILPDFDIRVDRLEIADLVVLDGRVSEAPPIINLIGKADIRSGRAYIDADGTIGSTDMLALNLDARPDDDIFDLRFDYLAPQDGALAGLLNLDAGYAARIVGKGSWTKWDGAFVARRNEDRLAALKLKNREGYYSALGEIVPTGLVEGLAARALGNSVALGIEGSLEDSIIDGKFFAYAKAINMRGGGSIDLADNAFDGFDLSGRLLDPKLFSETVTLNGARFQGNLDGAFSDLSITHDVALDSLVSGAILATEIRQRGIAKYDGTRFAIPLQASVGRIKTGNELVDPRLVKGTLGGALLVNGPQLLSDKLRIRFPGASADLALRGDISAGVYALAGPAAVQDFNIENVGNADGKAKIRFSIGNSVPWKLRANVAARIPQVSNATIANLAGPDIRLNGSVSMGGAEALVFRKVNVNAAKLTMALDGQIVNGKTSLTGSGRQADYGPFKINAEVGQDGPRAVLVFDEPYPPAGLKNVRVSLAPSPNGFFIETVGDSLLGPFDGELELVSPANGPTTITIDHLTVWKTNVTGSLKLVDGGADGGLVISGGGIDGTIGLAVRDGGQGFVADLDANRASFGGTTPLTIARGTVKAQGYLKDKVSTIEGTASGEGISYGQLFLGKMTGNAKLVNGQGRVNAAIAGRRSSRFALQLQADIAPSRISAGVRGSYAGKLITMPRRAVLIAQDRGGYRLEPTQINYGGGKFIAKGEVGGAQNIINVQLDDMPLSLLDLFYPDLGFGGSASGVVDYREDGTGSAKVKIKGLTRSGLNLSSLPIDVSLVAELMRDRLESRAVIDSNGKNFGRIQARISNLPSSGGLAERLQRGSLFAQMRYAGPADALWRLAAVDGLDVTGPASVAANATGTLANPIFRGTLLGNNLRARSSLSGTDIERIKIRGSFIGSQLQIKRMAGFTPNGGTVSGSGYIDFSNLGEQAPRIDLRAAAKRADLLNANGIKATISGPMRILSDASGGTIAGRVKVDKASWKLGRVNASQQLPQVKTREINIPLDRRASSSAAIPWRFLIDANAPGRIDVKGMGLDSEWRGNIKLRGTTHDLRMGGQARIIRGDYTFSGTQFDLTRGRIDFDPGGPINPRLDIRGTTEEDGLDVAVTVKGFALEPEIEFSSTPSLPTEEILARLLFGGSAANLAPTDAIQLGAAVASLNSGGGLDPINKLRTAIGLDRLRIVSADPTIGRQTSIAIGKNIGRKTYVEIITDGRGYSATQVEFRMTSWLSLLGSVSTIGRESVKAEVSRDY